MSSVEIETKKHIARVQKLVDDFCIQLKLQVANHDQSKLKPPELEIFEIYTAKLKDVTYGSEEYKQYLTEMKPALEHHYKYNRHHPEHFENGINGMDLVDLIEMLCDWIAASERHEDGNPFRSISINKKRFGYSDILGEIFINTLQRLYPPSPPEA